MKDLDYDELDPKIRKFVKALNDAGFHTTDSGDGSKYSTDMECALPYPHVVIRIRDLYTTQLVDRALDLRHVLNEQLCKKPGMGKIEASYDPDDDIAILMLSGITDEDLR